MLSRLTVGITVGIFVFEILPIGEFSVKASCATRLDSTGDNYGELFLTGDTSLLAADIDLF